MQILLRVLYLGKALLESCNFYPEEKRYLIRPYYRKLKSQNPLSIVESFLLSCSCDYDFVLFVFASKEMSLVGTRTHAASPPQSRGRTQGGKPCLRSFIWCSYSVHIIHNITAIITFLPQTSGSKNWQVQIL